MSEHSGSSATRLARSLRARTKNGLSALAVGALFCGACGDNTALEDGAGDSAGDQGLLQPKGEKLWPSPTIPVCWEHATFDDDTKADFRTNARIWVANTYSSVTRLDFTGWERCGDKPVNTIVLKVGDWSNSPVGWQGDEKPVEVKIGAVTLKPDDGRAPFHVVHEFAHALGFGHEFDRKENTSNDCEPNNGATGDSHGTPYDSVSITNSTYCGLRTELSAWDIVGLRNAYGGYYSGRQTAALTGNRIFTAFPGTNGVLYFQRQNDAAANGWDRPQLLGDPWNAAKEVTLGKNQDGRLEAFYIGTDDVIYHNWQTSPGGAWSGESILGGTRSWAKHLVVGNNADGRLEVFYMGTDNVLYHKWQDSPGGAWSDELPLIDAETRAINLEVAANTDGRLEVVYVDMKNQLNQTAQAPTDNGWSIPYTIGGFTTAKQLALMANADGRLEAVYTDLDDSLKHLWQETPGGNWSRATYLGSPAYAKRISLARNAGGQLELFYLGSDDVLRHIWQETSDSGWSEHAALGSESDKGWSITSAVNSDGRVEVFYTGTDGVPYHTWQVEPGGAWDPSGAM